MSLQICNRINPRANMKLKKHIVTAALVLIAGLAFAQDKHRLARQENPETEFRKTCSEITNAFAKKSITALNKYINPHTGVFIISRPGAIDAFTHEKKLNGKKPFAIEYPYKDTSAVKKHLVKYGKAPKFNCRTMNWDQEGLVADSSAKFSRLSEIMNFREKNEGAKYSDEEKTQINTIEKHLRKIVFTEIAHNRGLVFYMSYINGKWYLSIIDTAEGSCAG